MTSAERKRLFRDSFLLGGAFFFFRLFIGSIIA
jgi:hypothetical protein